MCVRVLMLAYLTSLACNLCLTSFFFPFGQIKKSMLTTETANTRNPSGQAAGNAKGSLVKTPANIKGSPNVKI